MSGERRPLAVGAALVVLLLAAASAIAANVALLAYAGRHNDPVGKLSPRAAVSHAHPTRVRPAAGRDSDD